MYTGEFGLKALFEQLGLESTTEAIDMFIAEHSISDSQRIHQATFWNDAQARFLCEALLQDAEWAPVVDDLSERLRNK